MNFQELIEKNLKNPKKLEKLYREDPKKFEKAFDLVFPKNPNFIVLKMWNERLHYKSPDTKPSKKEKKVRNEILLVIILSILAGTLAKIPHFLLDDEPVALFYSKNACFIVFLVLALYFFYINRPKRGIVINVLLMSLAVLIFFNVLPWELIISDSVTLSYFHQPFFLWTLLGLAFVGNNFKSKDAIMDYIKYNGEVGVYTFLLLVAGVIFTLITILLFSFIKVDIGTFIGEYIVIYGIFASPVVATYLTRLKISRNLVPTIARIFSPFVLIMLCIYLTTIIVLGENPFIDRNFLLVFNVVLLSVLAITVFIISNREMTQKRVTYDYINFALVVIVLLINIIALGAILFRLVSFGTTPNRIATLGANIVVFVHLLGIMVSYFRFIFKKSSVVQVKEWITAYLPVYAIWTAIVTFGFPFIFSFK